MSGDPATPPSSAKIPRRPPYSEDAEKGVLGSILQNSDIIDLCVENQLRPESFYVPAHRIIFEAMTDLSQNGRPIDVLTAANRLAETGAIGRIGGEVYLHQLIDSTPTAAHAAYYVDIVRQKHVLRSVIECARAAETACYDTEEDAFSMLGRVEQSFFDITDSHRGPMSSWPEMVQNVVDQIEEMSRGGAGVIRTGFVDMDRYMAGMRAGNMIILAARPSMGKTSLAMNIAENIARGNSPGGEPSAVGIFSLEMSRDDLVMRLLCTHARVSMHAIRSGGLSGRSDAFRSLVQAADVLSKAQIYLDDSPGLDVTELRARARRMRQKHHVQLLIVDYLQLLHSREYGRQGRQIETGAISGGLKAMAKELGIPIVVLSQLSRAPEARDQAIPRLSDLRDSGSIEQDADVVLLLRRPCRISGDPEYDDKRLAILDIAKNRNGPTHDGIRMDFDEEIMRFDDRREHGVDDFGPDEQVVGEIAQ